MRDVSYGTFTIPFRKLDNGFKVVAPSIRGGGMIEVNEMRNWWNGYEMEDFFSLSEPPRRSWKLFAKD